MTIDLGGMNLQAENPRSKQKLISPMDNDDVFLDKKSGRQFRLFKYFDHEVIQDVETSWINAGKFVQDVSKSPSLSKRKENSKIDFLNNP